ncbi:syndecan-1 [Patagioenas fasciata monilis]|uniref:Syndecan n=1 Tax=Patagioenas fasciata monilis TaxID=372326 RepID=A0A1V4JNC6_PATFA|nr:syndecan-1 [Patagioenas fasciata monilis]
MRNVVAVWLVALCFQAAVPQTTNLNLPPEDLDSSGDDDDGFSGSGAGPLTDQALTRRIPEEQTNSSLLAMPMDFNEQPFPGIESRTEKEITSPSATSSVVTEEPVVAVKDEGPVMGLPDEKPTNDAVTTVRSPTTHFPSVVHVTPSEISGTVHELEPKIPSSDVPDTKDVPEPHSTTHHEEDIAANPTTAAPKDVVPTQEEVSEDGSGDPGDFILTKDEDLVPTQNSEVPHDSERNAKAAGASGIMDRKEVLGGVIAGGLVGLVFAVFLVAFMLYRMKKKDEGSYSLDEPKQSNGGYQKPHKQEEFYA